MQDRVPVILQLPSSCFYSDSKLTFVPEVYLWAVKLHSSSTFMGINDITPANGATLLSFVLLSVRIYLFIYLISCAACLLS